MKVTKIKTYTCSLCNEQYEDILYAEECCPKDEPTHQDMYRCGECEEIYEDREEAKECCKE